MRPKGKALSITMKTTPLETSKKLSAIGHQLVGHLVLEAALPRSSPSELPEPDTLLAKLRQAVGDPQNGQ
jgi:hypothetical protein